MGGRAYRIPLPPNGAAGNFDVPDLEILPKGAIPAETGEAGTGMGRAGELMPDLDADEDADAALREGADAGPQSHDENGHWTFNSLKAESADSAARASERHAAGDHAGAARHLKHLGALHAQITDAHAKAVADGNVGGPAMRERFVVGAVPAKPSPIAQDHLDLARGAIQRAQSNPDRCAEHSMTAAAHLASAADMLPEEGGEGAGSSMEESMCEGGPGSGRHKAGETNDERSARIKKYQRMDRNELAAKHVAEQKFLADRAEWMRRSGGKGEFYVPQNTTPHQAAAARAQGRESTEAVTALPQILTSTPPTAIPAMPDLQRARQEGCACPAGMVAEGRHAEGCPVRDGAQALNEAAIGK